LISSSSASLSLEKRCKFAADVLDVVFQQQDVLWNFAPGLRFEFVQVEPLEAAFVDLQFQIGDDAAQVGFELRAG
jgi:hypothetical protein